jgi:hypothetical protein
MQKCYKERGGKEQLTYSKNRKANWIDHILLTNCSLKRVIEGKIEVTERRGRGRKQVLDDLKEAER